MSARPLVLLSDYGASDFYAGVTRAVLASSSPASRVIDLQHDLPPHDVAAASFVLARAFEYLPADAVIIVVVDPGVGTERRGLVLCAGERVLVGPDNGFASDLLCARGAAGARFFAIDEAAAAKSIGAAARGATFHGRDVFAPVAAAIARGSEASSFSHPVAGITLLPEVPSVSIDAGRVRGTGRYVDRFGNLLSDIPLAAIRHALGSEEQARVRVGGRDVGRLRPTYAGGRRGEVFALVNSWGLVEAAVNGGRAIDYFEGAPPRSIPFEVA
jgi:hypothetical protein